MNEKKNALNSRMRPIVETNLGVYAWQLPNGKYLGDTEGNMFNVQARMGDIQAMSALGREAAALGFPDGSAKFLPGQHRCTEEEYFTQLEEMMAGKRPDVNTGRV